MAFIGCFLFLALASAKDSPLTNHSLLETVGTVNCIAISKDGASLAVGTDAGEIYVWRQNDFQKRHTLRAEKTCIHSLAFAPNATLAAACEDGRVYVFDPVKLTLLFKLECDTRGTYSCVFSENGDVLYTGGANGKVSRWDVAKRQILSKVSFEKPVRSLSLFDADGLLAANLWLTEKEAGFDPTKERGEVMLLDLKKNTSKIIYVANKSRITFVKLLADDTLITAGFDGHIILHNIKTNTIIREWQNGDFISSAAVAENGNKIVTGGYGFAKLWNYKTGRMIENFEKKDFLVIGLTFSPDETSLAIAMSHRSLPSNALRLIRYISDN